MVECEFYNDTLMEAMKDCFNRYMVECECVPFAYGIWWLSVLIDTWWNVNCIIIYHRCVCIAVLIDTWWNVNVETIASGFAEMPF